MSFKVGDRVAFSNELTGPRYSPPDEFFFGEVAEVLEDNQVTVKWDDGFDDRMGNRFHVEELVTEEYANTPIDQRDD